MNSELQSAGSTWVLVAYTTQWRVPDPPELKLLRFFFPEGALQETRTYPHLDLLFELHHMIFFRSAFQNGKILFFKDSFFRNCHKLLQNEVLYEGQLTILGQKKWSGIIL